MAEKLVAKKVYKLTTKGQKAKTEVDALMAKMTPLMTDLVLLELVEKLETYRRGAEIMSQSKNLPRNYKQGAKARVETLDFVLSLIEEQRRGALYEYQMSLKVQ